MTWLFWRGITFVTPLDDGELAAALSPASSVREAQHGIEEVVRRRREGRPGSARWTERLVEVSRRPEPPVRRAAAWAMQTVVADAAVRARLAEMVAGETDECSRRNAACALAFSGDAAAALPVLRAMLAPHAVSAPAAGTVESVAAVGRRPREDEMVARLRGADGARVEALAGVPGRILEHLARPGDTVVAGAPLVVVAPDESHVLAAAAALAAAGTREDVDRLKAFVVPGGDVTQAMATQCGLAIGRIEARTGR